MQCLFKSIEPSKCVGSSHLHVYHFSLKNVVSRTHFMLNWCLFRWEIKRMQMSFFFPTIRGSVVPHSTVFNMFSSQIFIYRGEKIHNLFLRLDSLSLSKVLELINYPSNLMTTTKSVLKVVSGICWCKKAAVCRADHQQKIA